MLKLLFSGIAIGIANIIPGVSGGTIAFILGIYDKLTEAIGNFILAPKSKKIEYSKNEFLASLVKENRIDWSRINAFHMDEYIGLEEDAPQRFGHFLKESIFGKVPFKQVNYINGKALPSEECARYEALLKQYPADIVCLGIGENGHIAFNDPHVADFKDPQAVKVVDLDQACRQQLVNDGCFQSINEVPTHAYTLTIPALLSADYMYCIVPGESKANAVYHTLYGEISITCPASVLRTKDNVTLYLDANSASLIETKTF